MCMAPALTQRKFGRTLAGMMPAVSMEPRITQITLGVIDLPQSVRLYRDGLCWPSICQEGGSIAVINTTGTRLSLYLLKNSPPTSRRRFSPPARALAASTWHTMSAPKRKWPQCLRWRNGPAAGSSSRRRTFLGAVQRLFQRCGRLLLGCCLEPGRARRRLRLYEADVMKTFTENDNSPL
jgi:hypothetical protein